MPISSHQIGGLIGGQQAMFGNFHSYAQQISPYGQQGPVGYSNPMAGMGEMMQPPPAPHAELQRMGEQFGTGAVGMMGHIPGAMGMMGVAGGIGGLMGSRALGAVGGAASMLDPFSAGIGGFARGIGWQSGAGIGANLGRLGSMGIGGIARAGVAGLGGAALAAAPAMLATEAIRYGAGQMVQGAQYQNQVGNVLQNQFRFLSPGGGTGGYGFSGQERKGISDMMREMGHKEMMSTPSEMLRLLQQGAGMGMFKAVSDAKEFKKKFQEMVGTVKEVAKVMNTSLEGAMPFLAQARQQGFWTPQDILRNATMARSTAAATGMSVAQVQGMMGQGAQMARAVGAQGRAGARGMARSLETAAAMVGGPGRAGMLSEEQVGELTGGMQGPEAVAALAQNMQEASTRFARSNVARWTIAALGRDKFSQLDPAKVRALSEGRISIGQIGGGARGNIGRQGAANFVMNEERLRGQLIEMGPQAQMGFAAGLVGERLYSEKPMDQYVVRRMLKRFGIAQTSQEADAKAKIMRDLPRMMQEMKVRSTLEMDQTERNQEDQLSRSWDGVKRQMGKWWDANVKEPLQKAGADMAHSASEWFERASDRMFGRVQKRHQIGAVSQMGGRAMSEYALTGNTRQMEIAFGERGSAKIGGGAGALGLTGFDAGMGNAFGGQGVLRGAQNLYSGAMGMGFNKTNANIEWLARMGVKEGAVGTEAERQALLKQGGYLSGRTSGGPGVGAYRVMAEADVKKAVSGYQAAVGGDITEERAKGLGYDSAKEAKVALEKGKRIMGDPSLGLKMQRIARETGKSGRELLEEYTRRAQKGEFGEDAKSFLGQGDRAEQVHRLHAAMDQKTREGYGGGDLRGEAPSQIDPFRMTEKQLAEHTEKQEARLAEAAGGEGGGPMKWVRRGVEALDKAAAFAGGPLADLASSMGLTTTGLAKKLMPKAVTQESVGKLREKGGPMMDEAIRTLANDKATPEEKTKARQFLKDFRSENKDLPDDQARALEVMGGEGGNRQEADAAMKGIAGAIGTRDQQAVAALVGRRVNRMKQNMGEQYDQAMALTTAVGAEASGLTGIGKEVEGLVKGAGTEDPYKTQDRLSKIAAAASKMDPKQLAEFKEKFAGVPGAEMISEALEGGTQAKETSKALVTGGKGGMGRAYQLVQELTGRKLTTAQYRALQKGDKKAAEALLSGVEGGRKEMAEKLFGAIGSQDEAAATDVQSRMAGERAGGALTGVKRRTPEEVAEDIAKKAKGGEMFGRLGSGEGMHQQMLITNRLLGDIAAKVGKEGNTGAPAEKPVGGAQKKTEVR